MKPSVPCCLSMTLRAVVFLACKRSKTTEQSNALQPAGVIDRTVQETVEGIKGPMDKARGVEEMLGQDAERTAEQASQTGP
jgi:hypothetical protein